MTNTVLYQNARDSGLPPWKPGAHEFLFEASRRAGIVDELGSNWAGFENLALPLAFFHCVPDATLPLYFWERNGWSPLIRRR